MSRGPKLLKKTGSLLCIFLLLCFALRVSFCQSNEKVDHDDDFDDEKSRDGAKMFNFASQTAGAVVLDKSPPSAKGYSNLLNDDKDKYGISPCSENKWIVIGLSEDVLITSVAIANYERYSSMLKEFRLYAANSYPSDQWIDLGSYTAEARLGEQLFNVTNHSSAHTRYLKIKFKSHYESDALCTLSQIKVHGMTVIASFKQEVEWSDSERRDMLHQLSNEVVAEQLEISGDSPPVGDNETTVNDTIVDGSSDGSMLLGNDSVVSVDSALVENTPHVIDSSPAGAVHNGSVAFSELDAKSLNMPAELVEVPSNNSILSDDVQASDDLTLSVSGDQALIGALLVVNATSSELELTETNNETADFDIVSDMFASVERDFADTAVANNSAGFIDSDNVSEVPESPNFAEGVNDSEAQAEVLPQNTSSTKSADVAVAANSTATQGVVMEAKLDSFVSQLFPRATKEFLHNLLYKNSTSGNDTREVVDDVAVGAPEEQSASVGKSESDSVSADQVEVSPSERSSLSVPVHVESANSSSLSVDATNEEANVPLEPDLSVAVEILPLIAPSSSDDDELNATIVDPADNVSAIATSTAELSVVLPLVIPALASNFTEDTLELIVNATVVAVEIAKAFIGPVLPKVPVVERDDSVSGESTAMILEGRNTTHATPPPVDEEVSVFSPPIPAAVDITEAASNVNEQVRDEAVIAAVVPAVKASPLNDTIVSVMVNLAGSASLHNHTNNNTSSQSLLLTCFESLRLPEFQAKMTAKLNKSNNVAESESTLLGSSNNNVFRLLMSRIKALELENAIMDMYVIQLTDCYRAVTKDLQQTVAEVPKNVTRDEDVTSSLELTLRQHNSHHRNAANGGKQFTFFGLLVAWLHVIPSIILSGRENEGVKRLWLETEDYLQTYLVQIVAVSVLLGLFSMVLSLILLCVVVVVASGGGKKKSAPR